MRIKYPIIVEGKYDKIKILSLFDATVITTDGFGIFSDGEKELLLRRLAESSKIILLTMAEARGLIVLTDSDGGGELIRSHIKTFLPKEKIINLYTPRKEGKEKRKKAPSKEGVLGVEGIDADKLKVLLEPFSDTSPEKTSAELTKADLFAYGMSGTKNSSEKRKKLLKALDLPENMTPNAMLSAINILYSKEEIEKIIDSL